ncbi:MAG: hypothetical protein CME59_23085 [Halioglobus sp.]|nr:hypothetical protein [Halioglobus sp.]|tara:strand:- start:990 stop:1799 length:810 start_codon:yes stop_codon:yes gene_type:complete
MTRDIPEIRLGSVLLTLLEPVEGNAKELNRWYERDHFYAGCMLGENFFSGRRWVATRALKNLRFPQHTPITADIGEGSFLASYWIVDGRYEEALQWSIAQVHQLHAQRRMDPPRDNISSGFYRFEFGAFRDKDGVPAELALEHPFSGLGLSFIDLHTAPGNGATQGDHCAGLTAALQTSLRDSDCAMSLCLAPQPLPEAVPAYVPRVADEVMARRRLLLHFFDAPPQQCWQSFTDSLSAQLLAHGIADIVYAAPFIPTIPGTDTYVDEI